MTRGSKAASGRTVAGYEVLRVLGRGAMATVYLARQVDLDREVALKELSLSDTPDPGLARRFLREARLAGALTHPNIVTVHDYLEADGRPYIAMEYVPGGSVRPLVGRVSLGEAGGLLQGLLAGLAHAERRGIVHRDIKPENVMVTAEGSVKIADFGIAKATSTTATMTKLTTAGTTLGTPRYMAPERAMGQPVGPWTDLFSVGVMAFELLVGHTPFHETEAPMEILMRQINDPIPPLTAALPGTDPGLSDWIARMVEKEPAARTPSAEVAWTELDAILVRLLGPRRTAAAAGGGILGRPDDPAATTAALRAAMERTVAPETFRLERRPGSAVPRRSLLAVATGVFVALTAVGAHALRSREEPPRRSPVTASSGMLTLSAPAGWRASRQPAALPRPLRRAVTVTPGADGDAGSVTAGMMDAGTAGNVSLLPPAFLRSLPRGAREVPPRRRVVLRTSGAEAWRYAGLEPRGSAAPLTVYAVPTDAGVAVVVCRPPRARDRGFARACAAVAGGLRIRGARAFPLGPSARYADVLGQTLSRVRQIARENAEPIAGASGPAPQATALRSLAGRFAGAAGTLARLELSPADRTANARLVAALRGTAEAYGAAAAAIERGEDLHAARAAIVERQHAIDGALGGLEAAGYEVADDGHVAAPAPAEQAAPTPAGGHGGAPAPSEDAASPPAAGRDSGVGDSRSDDPSDDEPDEDEEEDDDED